MAVVVIFTLLTSWDYIQEVSDLEQYPLSLVRRSLQDLLSMSITYPYYYRFRILGTPGFGHAHAKKICLMQLGWTLVLILSVLLLRFYTEVFIHRVFPPLLDGAGVAATNHSRRDADVFYDHHDFMTIIIFPDAAHKTH